MKISTSFSIDANSSSVLDALLSDELARARMQTVKVTEYTHNRDGDTAVTDVRVSAEKLPDAAKRFAKNGLHVTLTAHKKSQSVEYSLDTHGLPGSLSFTYTISADGNATRVDVDGDFSIKIPLIGAGLEKKASGYIAPLFAKDAALIENVINA